MQYPMGRFEPPLKYIIEHTLTRDILRDMMYIKKGGMLWIFS